MIHFQAQKLSTDYRKQLEDAHNDVESAKQQKTLAYERLKDERNRADSLDKHRKILQQTVNSMNEKEVYTHGHRHTTTANGHIFRIYRVTF